MVISFLKQLIQNPSSVGHFVPTPRLLARAMLSPIGHFVPTPRLLARAMLSPISHSLNGTVVELGGGTGAITKPLIKKLPKNGQLFVFEPNKEFASSLRRLKNAHKVVVIENSAEQLAQELISYGVQRVDCIISSLPMMLWPTPIVQNILAQVYSVLSPDGVFVQLHHTPLMRSTYAHVFPDVRMVVMPLTLPPAFVMYCRKAARIPKILPRSRYKLPTLPQFKLKQKR